MISHLYVHIPFCHRICPYCAFYKHTPGNAGMGDFVQALLEELRLHQDHMGLRPTTLHFGGGTPTALSQTHLAELFEGLHQILDLSRLTEFCLEANPRTIGLEKARLMREAGVTRVSLGVQSWDPATLQVLGRDHSPAEAEEAYGELREAGIPSVNVDLMFSIPGPAADAWRNSLEKTLSLNPDHVSAYNLTYEEDTAFLEQLKKGRLEANPDRDADQFFEALDLLNAAGLEHYEISNYARPGHRSAHNSAYWHGADYLGIGPSASSTIGRERWKNICDTAAYLRQVKEGRVPVTESERLTERQWLMERIALELRTAEGTPAARLAPEVQPNLEALMQQALVQIVNDRVVLTREGKALADAVAEQLIADEVT